MELQEQQQITYHLRLIIQPGNADISLSTWSTTEQNMPHPDVSNVAAVSNMLGIVDWVNNAIDRFWDIHTTADLIFNYRGIENTTSIPTNTRD